VNFRVINSSGGTLSIGLAASPIPATLLATLQDFGRALPEATVRNEFNSLLQERDPALLAEGLSQFTRRQEAGEHPEIAAELYSILSQSEPALAGTGLTSMAQRSTERLQALRGGGNFGSRFEILARNFARQTSDPAMLGAMALGGAIFQTTRLAVLSRLATSPTASFLTRGVGSRALAWGAGFALEFPTFTFAARGLHEAFGTSQDWSRDAITRDLISSGLTLFLLKSSGAAGTSFVRRIEGGAAENAFLRFSQAAIPQAAAFTGIVASHWIETRLHLRPQSDAAGMLFDSLATLLQFQVGARLLQHAGFDGYERDLDSLHRSIQDSGLLGPRSGRNSGASLPGLNSFPALAGEAELIGPLTVFMSGPRRLPSDRPAPLFDPDDSAPGRILAHPTQLRDLKREIDDLDRVLNGVFRSESDTQSWRQDVKGTLKSLRSVIGELHERIGQEEGRQPLLPYLKELATEYRTAENLLERSLASQETPPEVDALESNRFLQYLIRSTNTLINFIDDAAPIQMPIENARLARSWLQRGLEGEALLDDTPTHPHFPYTRLPDGSFTVLGSKQLILVTGDENGARTFPLAEAGHRILHVNPDKSELSTTQRRLRYQTERKKSSGEWVFDPIVEFHASDEKIPPANLMEAYFPSEFSMLPPRSSPERLDVLTQYLEASVRRRLVPGGSAFILSESDGAVEDLANIALRTRGFEVLEVFYRRNHLPLIGGKGATIERGEALVSWMVLRRLTEDHSRP